MIHPKKNREENPFSGAQLSMRTNYSKEFATKMNNEC
jgi:hypothetical protein